MGRSSKVADSSAHRVDNIEREKSGLDRLHSHNWMVWKRFFNKDTDLMTKREIAERRKEVKLRRNAATFIPDYDEEQTVTNNENTCLEICDLEDSGHFEMKDGK